MSSQHQQHSFKSDFSKFSLYYVQNVCLYALTHAQSGKSYLLFTRYSGYILQVSWTHL